MDDTIYIQLAPIQLADGVGEGALVEASDAFQERFVRKQRGIRRRILLRAKHGGYADLVFFDSREDAERVAQAEASSPECLAFFSVMKPPDESLPDMGVLSFEHVKTYG